jgi:hypothetical protein
MVRRRHTQIIGTEPLTNLPYRAHSEYELALTQVMLADSFLSAYEMLNGPLPGRQRDQFVREQQLPAALLGVNPHHMPDTYGAMVDFLAQARTKFASGLQGREILEPFSHGSYPAGTAIGGLPFFRRGAAMFVVRAMSDISMSTMSAEERALIAIDRRPKLGSKLAVRASYGLLSRYLRSDTGREKWAEFVGESIAKTIERARAAESARGGRERAATFVVPDPGPFLTQLPDLVENWPGSTADYRIGDVSAKQSSVADRFGSRTQSAS